MLLKLMMFETQTRTDKACVCHYSDLFQAIIKALNVVKRGGGVLITFYDFPQTLNACLHSYFLTLLSKHILMQMPCQLLQYLRFSVMWIMSE